MPHQWSRKVLGYPLASLSVVIFPLTFAALAQPPDTPVLRIEAGMHTAPIRRIDVDAQARFLVTASYDKTARVWNIISGELLKVLRPPIGSGDEGNLYAVAISPNGGTVATAGWSRFPDNDIYLFDRASGRLQRRISGLPNVINHLAYAPDGRYTSHGFGCDVLRALC
jgi:WD40 repeat protein